MQAAANSMPLCRRASQALAHYSGVAIAIARELVAKKLLEQERTVPGVFKNASAAEIIAASSRRRVTNCKQRTRLTGFASLKRKPRWRIGRAGMPFQSCFRKQTCHACRFIGGPLLRGSAFTYSDRN
jgi:hypothetical protein